MYIFTICNRIYIHILNKHVSIYCILIIFIYSEQSSNLSSICLELVRVFVYLRSKDSSAAFSSADRLNFLILVLIRRPNAFLDDSVKSYTTLSSVCFVLSMFAVIPAVLPLLHSASDIPGQLSTICTVVFRLLFSPPPSHSHHRCCHCLQ